jgi:hypothetical protein
MALTNNFIKTENNFLGSLVLADAYWRVESVNSTKLAAQATVSVNKVDGDKKEQVATKSYNFTPDMQGDNPIRQAYKYLKTLPEFAGATDC